MELLERSITSLVQGANAVSRPVAFTLLICFWLTYAAHLYRHRYDWARGHWARSLFLFPLRGGHRHAVFQGFAWVLWALSAAITSSLHLSLLVEPLEQEGDAADSGALDGFLGLLGLRRPLISLTHVDAVSGAAAVSGLWGELFLLKALLVFEDDARLSGDGNLNTSALRGIKSSLRRDDSGSGLETAEDLDNPLHPRRRAPHQPQKLLAPSLASLLVCLMGLALSVTGFVLLLALEHMPDTASKVLYCCLALSCVFIGASSTHGLGGHLRYCAGAASSAGVAVAAAAAAMGSPSVGHHGHTSEGLDTEADEGPGWRFFQPFQGGTTFVATQAIGWTLFSSTVAAVLMLAKQLVAEVGHCLRCWALAVGALMVATQLVLGVSLLTYQHRRRARKLLQPMLHHPLASFYRAAGLVMPVVMMYLPLHISCSAMAALFVLLPARLAAAALVAALVTYFALTLPGHPAHTGCRRWKWLCLWFSREVEGSLAWWAGRLEIIRDFKGTAHDVMDELRAQEHQQHEDKQSSDSDKQFDTGASSTSADGPSLASPSALPRRYMLGFHPHGLYPTGAGFVPLMPSVHRAFPGFSIITLTASIVHYLPGLREIAGWAGFRQVVRATIRRALHDTGAVLLCPGGQAELVFADRAIPPRGSPAAAAEGMMFAAPAPMSPTVVPEAASAAVVAASDSTPSLAKTQAAAALSLRPPRALPTQQKHQLVIYGGHQGFVRLALEEGAWLVPVLALGEVLQLRNLISAPEMQRITYKRLGFPVPFILAGRWGLTTLPLRNPLVYVLGAPLQPLVGWEQERLAQLEAHAHAVNHPDPQTPTAAATSTATDKPRPHLRRRHLVHRVLSAVSLSTGTKSSKSGESSVSAKGAADGKGAVPYAGGTAATATQVVVPQKVVDEYHAAFYAALAGLWYRHRHRHPVLQYAELVFEWGRQGPPRGWEEALEAAQMAPEQQPGQQEVGVQEAC